MPHIAGLAYGRQEVDFDTIDDKCNLHIISFRGIAMTKVILNPYRRMMRDGRPAILGVLAFSAIVNVLMLSGSIYMLQVYDRVLASGSVPTLVVLFSIVVVLYAFLGLFDFLRSRVLGRVSVRMEQATGGYAFAAWIRSGLGQAAGSGEALQPIQMLDLLRAFVASPALVVLFDLPFVPLFVGILFLVHPLLGVLVIAGALITALLALINRSINGPAIHQTMSLEAANRDFSERVRRNSETIVAMGMQDDLTTQWCHRRNTAMLVAQTGNNASEILASTSKAFRMVLQSAILTLGAFLVLRGEISGGMIIASSILSGRALAPVDQIIGQWRSIGSAIEAHRALQSFFATLPVPTPRIDLPAPKGSVSVLRLTKLAPGTSGTDRPRILSHVNFSLEPGDGLGVIGNSSSGKSTLARLLTGAWTPDGGEIRFDGATLDQWDPQVLGRAIGYLPQVFDLLPGTIGANIARFDPEARAEDVIAAAQMADVHEMILKLPNGYSTNVGERSGDTPLSGGQIQRLGLARAVYRLPALVVLDEPNANLDVAGDAALSRTIATLRAAGSTVIVMAHRPSALATVNKVLVLHDGIVAQFGEKGDILSASPAQQPTTTSTGPVRQFPDNTHPPLQKATAELSVSAQPLSRSSEQLFADRPSSSVRLENIFKAERENRKRQGSHMG